MSIKFHLYLGGALSLVLGGLALAIGASLLENGEFLAFLIAIAFAFLPRLLFCYLFHAHCPKCGGTARQQPGVLIGKDIHYTCINCGYTQKTEVAYGSDSWDCF